MAALMPVSDARRNVLDGAAGLAEELAPLDQACGRVLARDVAALRTQPPDAMSAMDGYAVRAADAVLSVDGSPEDLNSTILWLVRGNQEDVEPSTNAV